MDLALILSALGNIGLGVAANAVYDGLKGLRGSAVSKEDVMLILQRVTAIQGRVDDVYRALEQSKVFAARGSRMVEVAGTHNASGTGFVIGLDIQAPAKIMPGTVVNAYGSGNIIGTRIGGA